MKTTHKLGDFWDSSPHLENEFSALLDELGVPSNSTLRTPGHLWVLETASAMAGVGSANFSLPQIHTLQTTASG